MAARDGGKLPDGVDNYDSSTGRKETFHDIGLRNYALTYSGLFLMENAIKHDAPGLGTLRPGTDPFGATNELKDPIRGRIPGRGCTSRRSVRITLKSPRMRTLRVTVNGKRVRSLRGRALQRVCRGRAYRVRVSFRGRRVRRVKGLKTVVVRVTGRTRGGRRISTTRRYRLCTPKQRRAAAKRKAAAKRRRS